MKRLAPLAALLALATPASAQATMTIHQARHEIRQTYAHNYDTPRNTVRVNHCRRHSYGITCRVTQADDNCYYAETWVDGPVYVSQADEPNPESWGQCPIIGIATPIDGTPAYDPPGPAPPQGP